MTGELIRTERAIFDKMTNSSEQKKWIDFSLFVAELHKKYNESYNLPGDLICPTCGKKYNALSEPCPECQKTIHKRMKIQCVIDCGPNGISKQDGVFILDQLTKLFLSRGITPLDIDFLEPYVWMDVEVSKDEIEALQKQGVLQR